METGNIIFTTDSTIEDFELLAVAIPTKRTPIERRTAAILLRDALREAYGDDVAMVAVGDEWCGTYDPQRITTAIADVQAYITGHPQATEKQIAEELRTPAAGIYGHYMTQCRCGAEAEELTRATLLYCYALEQAAAALRTIAEEPQPTTDIQSQPAANTTLPQWAQTDRAKRIFEAMAVEGMLCRCGVGWQWTGDNDKLCAYFIAKCNDELKPSDSKPRGRQWKPFEDMFGKKQLCRTFNQYSEPENCSIIDTIFNRNAK